MLKEIIHHLGAVVDQQLMEIQRVVHHHQQIQPCTFPIHCQWLMLLRRRHTFLFYFSGFMIKTPSNTQKTAQFFWKYNFTVNTEYWSVRLYNVRLDSTNFNKNAKHTSIYHEAQRYNVVMHIRWNEPISTYFVVFYIGNSVFFSVLSVSIISLCL